MELRARQVIVIGERDGVNGATLAACVESAGGKVLYMETQCFV